MYRRLRFRIGHGDRRTKIHFWHQRGGGRRRLVLTAEEKTRSGAHGGIFYTRTEAKVLIERWRREYNQVRPHSALGYRPPAPEAVLPLPPGFAPLHPSTMALGLT